MGCDTSTDVNKHFLTQSKRLQDQLKKIQEHLKNNNETYKTMIKIISSQSTSEFEQIKIYDHTTREPQQKYLPLSADLKGLIKKCYELLIHQKLQLLQDQKILSNEFKNQMSWNIVYLNFVIMARIINQPNFSYDGTNFKGLQIFQKQFIEYMKKQYPRGDKVDAGQLSKQFKENIDFTDEFQNNLLNNLNIYFISESELEIKKTIKKLINKLIEETDKHYLSFEKLMKNHIFNIQEQDNKNKSQIKNQHSQKQKKSVHTQIGRKISQNSSKYKRMYKNSLQIKSTQIFRVLIKWIQDLRQTIKEPQMKISLSNEWSFVKIKQNHEPQLIKCEKIYRQMFKQQGLFQKIKDLGLEKPINRDQTIEEFHISLIKILIEAQKYQIQPQHLAKQDAQIIKFCTYNMKLYRRIIEQQLVHLIQILVKASSQINKKIKHDSSLKNKDTQTYLSLIKFKISDLLRCKFQGNRKQIRAIYEKFKSLQSNGVIKILKIKNRFKTDLSDAIITFKITDKFNDGEINKNSGNQQASVSQTQKNSDQQTLQKDTKVQKQGKKKKQCHLICQCQLILAQNSKAQNKKLKNIQTLNHYLYELERSQFFVLGEAILNLNYKYDVIQYSNQIKFGKIKDIRNCSIQFSKEQNHLVQTIQIENQSFCFVCSGCWRFYNPFQNVFEIKTCKKCSKYLCYICNRKPAKSINNEKFQQDIKISGQKQSNTKQIKAKQINQQQDINVFIKEKYFQYFYELFNQKSDKKRMQNQNKNITNIVIKHSEQQINLQQTKEIIKQKFRETDYNIKSITPKGKGYIKVKQFILYIYKKYHGLDYQGSHNRINFMILSYAQNKVICRGYEYQANDQRLINVQNQLQIYQGHQFFQFNQYDALFYPSTQNKTKKSQFQQMLKKNSYKAVYFFKNDKKKQSSKQYFYRYFDYQLKKTYLIYDIFHLDNSKPTIKQFKDSLLRKRLVYMSKNIQDKDLSELHKPSKQNSFNYLKHFSELKYIDLCDNRITIADNIFNFCQQLEYLILQKNKLQKVVISNPLVSLQLLDLSSNFIKSIVGLEHLKCLKKLELDDNLIQTIFIDNHNPKKINRAQTNLKNQLQPLTNKKQSQLQAQTTIFNFPLLLYINLNKNRLNNKTVKGGEKNDNINLNEKKLQILQKKNENTHKQFINSIGRINAPKLQLIDFSNNELQNIDQFMSMDFKNLTKFYCGNNKIKKIGKINAPKLQQIYLYDNLLMNLSQFFSSSFPQLKLIDMSSNSIQNLPKVQLPQLQKLILENNKLSDQSQIFQSQFDNLIEIDIRINKLTKIPNLKTPNLQQLLLKYNNIKQISQIQLQKYSKLKVLGLSQNKNLKRIPVFNLLKLQEFGSRNNNIQNVYELFDSELKELKMISLQGSENITKLPNIQKFSKLIKLDLSNCPIKDISALENSKIYSRLQEFKLSIKAQSEQQFNQKKLLIQQNLKNTVKNLEITMYQNKTVGSIQQVQIVSTKNIQMKPSRISQRTLRIQTNKTSNKQQQRMANIEQRFRML